MGNEPIPNVPVAANVKAFGAKGDGITDDSRAFLNAIASTNNGALFIPAGTYRISQQLPLKSNFVLRGEGPDRTILYFPKSASEILGHCEYNGQSCYSYGGSAALEVAHDVSVRELGIEELAIEFPPSRYAGHHAEAGYNGINFQGSGNPGRRSDSWIRNVTISNFDVAISLTNTHNTTVTGVRLKGRGGHHGFRLAQNSDHNLFTNFTIENTSVHDITVQENDNGNVFSNGSGVDINFDHHGGNPHENLFSNIDVGAGSRIHDSSGNDPVQGGPRETFWNVKTSNGQAAISYCPWQQCTVVGAAHSDFSGNLWVEAIKPANLLPQDIHEAQLTRRLGRAPAPPSPPKPAPPTLPPPVPAAAPPETPPSPGSQGRSSFSTSPGEVAKTAPVSGVTQPPPAKTLANSTTMIRHSNNFAPDHPVQHLWDGCLEDSPQCTAGAGNITSFWVEFDLGKLYDLTSARLFGDANGDWWSTSWALKYKQSSEDPWTAAFENTTAFFNDWSTRLVPFTARYVRVEVLGNQSRRATQARELELYGTPRISGSDLVAKSPTDESILLANSPQPTFSRGASLTKSATITGHSNNFAPDHPMEHLWDGCLEGTSACTAGAGNVASFWIEFDLGKVHDLTSARLFGDRDGDWWSTSWTLQYKQNLADPWSTAFKNTDAFLNGWSTEHLNMPARYVRVEVFGNQGMRATQARELELYGIPR